MIQCLRVRSATTRNKSESFITSWFWERLRHTRHTMSSVLVSANLLSNCVDDFPMSCAWLVSSAFCKCLWLAWKICVDVFVTIDPVTVQGHRHWYTNTSFEMSPIRSTPGRQMSGTSVNKLNWDDRMKFGQGFANLSLFCRHLWRLQRCHISLANTKHLRKPIHT